MHDEIRDEQLETVPLAEDTPTGDAEKGAVLGGVGGLVTGAIAGAAAGPAGAVIGAVIGGVVGAAASGAAVAAVNRIDDDTKLSGLPDDMSLTDPTDREPMVIDRTVAATPLGESVVATEIPMDTPLGVGMPEAAAMAGPANTSTYATGDMPNTTYSSVNAAELTDPANAPIDRGGVTGDVEEFSSSRAVDQRTSDGGWERDNDANTIDVNTAGVQPVNLADANESGSIVEKTGTGGITGTYAYADNPEDDRRESGP